MSNYDRIHNIKLNIYVSFKDTFLWITNLKVRLHILNTKPKKERNETKMLINSTLTQIVVIITTGIFCFLSKYFYTKAKEKEINIVIRATRGYHVYRKKMELYTWSCQEKVDTKKMLVKP